MFTGSGGTSTGWCLLCCGAECYGAVWRQMRGGEQNNTRKVRVGRAMSGGKSGGRSLTIMLASGDGEELRTKRTWKWVCARRAKIARNMWCEPALRILRHCITTQNINLQHHLVQCCIS